MDATKNRIIELVEDYKKMFPEEYGLAVADVKRQKSNLKDKFARIDGDGIVERALLSFPETLFTILNLQLDRESFAFFKSKVGSRWFGNHYKEFALTDKI